MTGGTKTKWGEQEIDWSELAAHDHARGDHRILAGERRRKAEHERFCGKRCGEGAGCSDSIPRIRTWHTIRNEPAGKTIASLFEAAAEEHLMQPTIIYEFPTAVSPLSKQKPDEPDWTERWEIYIGQMEISNGFSELNDPEDQRRRFEGAIEGTRARRRRGPPDG